MRKFYRSTIAIAILSAAMVFGSFNPIFAAEENTEESAEFTEEGVTEGSAMTEDSTVIDDVVPEQTAPLVSTPDGSMVAGSFSDDLLPLLFHKTTTTYSGTTVEAAQFDNGYVLLLYVTDSAGGNGTFKQYDESTGELKDFRMIAGPNDSYIIILPLAADTTVPEGFEEVILDWNGQTLSAYVNTTATAIEGSDTSAADYLLLYAVSSGGRQGFYLYDQVEGTYQRYFAMGGTSSKSSDGGILGLSAAKDGDTDAIIRLIIMGALLVLVIVLLIMVILFAVRLKEYSEYDYIDEDEYNEMNRDKSRTGRLGLTGRMPRTGSTGRMPVVEDERVSMPERTRSQEGVRSHEPEQVAERIREQESQRTPERVREQEMQRTPERVREQEMQRTPERVREQEPERTPERVRRESAERREERQRPAQRRNLLETCDIADLDDILNDPNLTSNLPIPSEIRKEIERQAAQDAQKREASRQARENEVKKESKPHSYENMQVTVDKYDAGMPAEIDTEIIAENLSNTSPNMMKKDASAVKRSEDRYAQDKYGRDYYPEEEYTQNQYETDSYPTKYDSQYNDPYADDEDDYRYMSRAERKERKALEKQRKREAREAEKDAKYLEKERRRAEKHKKYGYDEATPMDWSALGDSMREESTAADDRRPTGYNEDNLPSYMRGGSNPRRNEESDKYQDSVKRRDTGRIQNTDRHIEEPTEEERANAAADAVIAAARGTSKRERDYREYRQSARNQYEEFRREDETRASANTDDDDSDGNITAGSGTGPIPQDAPKTQMPLFSQDIDEDFEFEFLNIRRPQ